MKNFLLMFLLLLLCSSSCNTCRAANNSGTEIGSLLSVSESFERMMNRTESWSEKCHLNIFSILNEVSFEEGKRLQIDLSEKEVFRGEFRIFASDGSIFHNKVKDVNGNWIDGYLPVHEDGYYREYVHPIEGQRFPGPHRIITGANGEIYYSSNHYQTFIKLR